MGRRLFKLVDIVEVFLSGLLGQVVAGLTVRWAFVQVVAANDIIEFFLAVSRSFKRVASMAE